MKFADYLGKEDILTSLAATAKDDVLSELATAISRRHPHLAQDEVLQVLLEREQLCSTGIGDGIAVPHGKLRMLDDLLLLCARSTTGVDFSALDGRPVQLFFVLLGPESANGLHLKMLARISRLLKDAEIQRDLLAAQDVEAMHSVIMQQDELI